METPICADHQAIFNFERLISAHRLSSCITTAGGVLSCCRRARMCVCYISARGTVRVPFHVFIMDIVDRAKCVIAWCLTE
jgi:hypothetical protein